MSTTTPIPDEQPQDGATPTLADYARALRRYTEAYTAERSARRAVRDYTADSSPAGGRPAAGKDLDRALEDAVTVRRRLEEDLQGIRKALEVASGKETEELVADFILKWHPKPGVSIHEWTTASSGEALKELHRYPRPAAAALLTTTEARSSLNLPRSTSYLPGSAAWGDLEDSNGSWRRAPGGGAVWRMATHGDGVLDLKHGGSTWRITGDSVLNLADARELVQLMEKVERQRQRAAFLDVPPPPAEVAKAIDEYGLEVTSVDPRVTTEDDGKGLAADPEEVEGRWFVGTETPAKEATLVEIRDLLKELVGLQLARRVSAPQAAPRQSVDNHAFSDFVDFHEQVSRGAHHLELPLLGSELAQIRDRVFGPGSAHHEERLTGLDGFRARLVLAMLALHHLERVRGNGKVFVLAPNAPAARSVLKVAAEMVTDSPSLGGWALQEYGLGRLKAAGRGSIVALTAHSRRTGSAIEGETPSLILAPWLRTDEHETALRVLQSKAAKTASRWVVPTVRVESKED